MCLQCVPAPPSDHFFTQVLTWNPATTSSNFRRNLYGENSLKSHDTNAGDMQKNAVWRLNSTHHFSMKGLILSASHSSEWNTTAPPSSTTSHSLYSQPTATAEKREQQDAIKYIGDREGSVQRCMNIQVHCFVLWYSVIVDPDLYIRTYVRVRLTMHGDTIHTCTYVQYVHTYVCTHMYIVHMYTCMYFTNPLALAHFNCARVYVMYVRTNII